MKKLITDFFIFRDTQSNPEENPDVFMKFNELNILWRNYCNKNFKYSFQKIGKAWIKVENKNLGKKIELFTEEINSYYELLKRANNKLEELSKEQIEKEIETKLEVL